jgi:stalled ribosome alternative rescue factor ArfA
MKKIRSAFTSGKLNLGTRFHKPGKGAGSYKRNKKVNID